MRVVEDDHQRLLGHVGLQRVAEPLGIPQPVAGIVAQRREVDRPGAGGTHRGQQRAQRRRPVQLDRPAGCDGEPECAGMLADVGQQPGLADAGRAGQHRAAAGAVRGGRQYVMQHGQLAVPTDHGGASGKAYVPHTNSCSDVASN